MATKKPGPKTGLQAGTPVSRKSITIDEMSERKATVLGGGNVSMGIRLALDVAFDLYQKGRVKVPAQPK